MSRRGPELYRSLSLLDTRRTPRCPVPRQSPEPATALANQCARRIAEWRAREEILDDQSIRHIPLALVHADEHERQRAIRLGAKIEAQPAASRLRQQLIDHRSRKVTASLRDPRWPTP